MDGDNRSGWTPNMVLWNTIGTVLGAVFGGSALVISLVALLRT